MLTPISSSAWAVNFNLGVRSFEEEHIKGIHNLVQLSLSVLTPAHARLFFCSTPPSPPLWETLDLPPSQRKPIFNLNAALPQGYARSKLVSEHMVRNAARDCGRFDTHITHAVRLSVMGKLGLWNDTEAVPLIIRSALTLKAPPALYETGSWLPVDNVAVAILDLAGYLYWCHSGF